MVSKGEYHYFWTTDYFILSLGRKNFLDLSEAPACEVVVVMLLLLLLLGLI